MSNLANDIFEEEVQEKWETYIHGIEDDKGWRAANGLRVTCNTLEKKCEELGIKYE